ncbi:molybdenum cofactor guanylyltransferase [Nocardioides sp.]|uniref:molybdenum cofactor guanylyltransferase n=1 Tax=Nocardioides sp. TaxID=35761 RepID=UPI002ED65786
MTLAAVVLTGGTGARLGGRDKASIELGGSTLLERALAATVGAHPVVVVGEAVPTSRPVTFAREEPAYGGPVAGLLAGRRALTPTPDLLVVLAVDMPFVTAGTVARLVAAANDGDGSVLTGPDGRRRLVLVVRTARLDDVSPTDPHGCPVHVLLAPLDLRQVTAVGLEGRGVDTVEDLRELEAGG